MTDSTQTDEPAYANPQERLEAAIADRVVANVETLRAIDAYLESNPPTPGLYEGLRRMVRRDTEELKRIEQSPRTPVEVPEEERPEEWGVIKTPFDPPTE